MSGICPELDARLSAELDRYYFSTDGSGLNLDRREKHRVINALHRLWNIEEIACYGVGFATEDIRKVILDLMKPAHIRLALKTVDFNSGKRQTYHTAHQGESFFQRENAIRFCPHRHARHCTQILCGGKLLHGAEQRSVYGSLGR